jgi:hypothetical protein
MRWFALLDGGAGEQVSKPVFFANLIDDGVGRGELK